ncbi:MAG: DNA gyrase modulator, partial [bacterium]|nr:DNA gyrase modulator [bacterium]
MFPAEEIPRILKRALSQGGEFAELYVESGQHTSLALEDQKIEKVIAGLTKGAGLRVLAGHRTIYAHTNDLSIAAVAELAEIVRHAVGEATGGADGDLVLTPKRPPFDITIKIAPPSCETAVKVKLVKAADGAARGIDPRVRQVSVMYGDSCKRVLIANSAGELAEDERVSLVGRVQVVAREGQAIQTGLETLGGAVGFELFDTEPHQKVNAVVRTVRLVMEETETAHAAFRGQTQRVDVGRVAPGAG